MTVGRLVTQRKPLSSVEVLGRIRMVMQGKLELLWNDMLNEASREEVEAERRRGLAEAEAERAARARRAVAEAEAAAPVEAALDEAAARTACEAGGVGAEAAEGARVDEAEEARRNEKLLQIVLQLVNSGYLSTQNIPKLHTELVYTQSYAELLLSTLSA